MSTRFQNRRTFRPTLDGLALEERVVMASGAGTMHAAVSAAASSVLTRRELLQAYRTQLQAAANDLKQYIQTQLGQLYANGTPSASQVAALRDQLAGAVNATAFRVSSQLALLPRATDNLVAQVQNSLLSGNNRSLVGRLNNLLNSNALVSSPGRLLAAMNRAVTTTSTQGVGQLNNFVNTTPIFRLSADPVTGQPIPLQQFMAQQAIGQFGNSLGQLTSAFPNVANSAIFQNGAMITDPAVQAAFAGQLQNAVGIAANQLANNLAVFPSGTSLFPGNGTGTNVLSQVSQALFGAGATGGTTGTGTSTGITGTGTCTGTTAADLFTALGQIPTTGTSSQFFQNVNSAFTNTFQNVTGTLNPFFGITTPGTAPVSLPNAPFSNVFQLRFSQLGNGFNSGFGNGFMGFGQPLGATTGGTTGTTGTLGNGFGTGFFGLTGLQNTNFGFTTPSFTGFGMTGLPVGTGVPVGTGTGIGTTTGTGTTTTGPGGPFA